MWFKHMHLPQMQILFYEVNIFFFSFFFFLCFFLCVCVLFRWPRLPADHSSPLDFGATPVNDSKVCKSLIIIFWSELYPEVFLWNTKGISLVRIFRWQSTCDALHRIIIIVWTINLSRNIIWTMRLLHFLYQVKNFTLKNPTGSVVSVEIRTLSSYPFPLEALDMLTKWYIP